MCEALHYYAISFNVTVVWNRNMPRMFCLSTLSHLTINIFICFLTIRVPNARKYIQEVISAYMPVHVPLPEYRSGFLQKILAFSANLKFPVIYLIEFCWSNILPKIE